MAHPYPKTAPIGLLGGSSNSERHGGAFAYHVGACAHRALGRLDEQLKSWWVVQPATTIQLSFNIGAPSHRWRQMKEAFAHSGARRNIAGIIPGVSRVLDIEAKSGARLTAVQNRSFLKQRLFPRNAFRCG